MYVAFHIFYAAFCGQRGGPIDMMMIMVNSFNQSVYVSTCTCQDIKREWGLREMAESAAGGNVRSRSGGGGLRGD